MAHDRTIFDSVAMWGGDGHCSSEMIVRRSSSGIGLISECYCRRRLAVSPHGRILPDDVDEISRIEPAVRPRDDICHQSLPWSRIMLMTVVNDSARKTVLWVPGNCSA